MVEQTILLTAFQIFQKEFGESEDQADAHSIDSSTPAEMSEFVFVHFTSFQASCVSGWSQLDLKQLRMSHPAMRSAQDMKCKDSKCLEMKYGTLFHSHVRHSLNQACQHLIVNLYDLLGCSQCLIK